MSKGYTDSRRWGPFVWYTMHQLAYFYIRENVDITQRDKNIITFYLTSLSNILPCPNCRVHFKMGLRKYPIKKHLTNGEAFFSWTVLMHNKANKGLKKKLLTVEDAKKIHSQPLNKALLKNYYIDMIIKSVKKPYDTRRKQVVGFLALYPSSDGRDKINKYRLKNDVNKLKTHAQLTLWAKGALLIINQL